MLVTKCRKIDNFGEYSIKERYNISVMLLSSQPIYFFHFSQIKTMVLGVSTQRISCSHNESVVILVKWSRPCPIITEQEELNIITIKKSKKSITIAEREVYSLLKMITIQVGGGI